MGAGATPRYVRLPVRLDWSPRAAARDLVDPEQRAGLYAQVLDTGTADDVRSWVDPDDLVRLWPNVPVPRHLRRPVGEMVEALKRQLEGGGR